MFKQFAARAVFLALPTLLTAQTYLPDGKGKEILDNYCQECHGLDPVIRQSLSAVEWRKLVARMVQKGTTLRPAEVDALVDYLTAYFGPESVAPKVNINRATASELETVLGLRSTEAEALVRYRTSHGRFRGWNDLLKVRPVDTRKLRMKRDAIEF